MCQFKCTWDGRFLFAEEGKNNHDDNSRLITTRQYSDTMLFEERRTSAIIRLNYKRHLSHCEIITEAHAGAPTALLRPTAATNSAGRWGQRVLQEKARGRAVWVAKRQTNPSLNVVGRCGRLFWSTNYRFPCKRILSSTDVQQSLLLPLSLSLLLTLLLSFERAIKSHSVPLSTHTSYTSGKSSTRNSC